MVSVTISPPLHPDHRFSPQSFTVQEYHRLTNQGILGEDDRVELIKGTIVEMAAKGTVHETCIRRLLRQLMGLLGNRATLQCQAPITLSFDGEPEPDFAIVENRADDYVTAHPVPSQVLWVIEVADSSLAYDRETKLPLYAEAGIGEYWLFNLVDGYLEVYRQPRELKPESFGYRHRHIVLPEEEIPLPTFPNLKLSLNQIFK
jgi:Uma2 family endonuclease